MCYFRAFRKAEVPKQCLFELGYQISAYPAAGSRHATLLVSCIDTLWRNDGSDAGAGDTNSDNEVSNRRNDSIQGNSQESCIEERAHGSLVRHH